MNTCKIGLALLALVGWTHLASAQVRPLGRVPAGGQVTPASHCSSCASGGGGGAYVGNSYFDGGYGGCDSCSVPSCGVSDCGGCGSCAPCGPGPGTRLVCGAVGLVGELLCDVKTVVGTGVHRVANCLLPCGGCCPPSAGCASCASACDSGCDSCGAVSYGGGEYMSGGAGCSSCGASYEMAPSGGAPTPAPAPAAAPAGNPFQDDPVSHAQSAVRREAMQRTQVAANRTRSTAHPVNPAGYRSSVEAVDRFRPAHETQLRRLSNTARSNQYRAYSNAPTQR